MKTRKLLVLVLMIAVVAIVGYALYYLFFRPEGPPGPPINEVPTNEIPSGLVPSVPGEPEPTPVTPPGELPIGVTEIAQGGVTVVSSVAADRTVGASLSPDGNLSFYNKNNDQFYRMRPDGELLSLSSKKFYNVENATFDPEGTSAIIEYPDGSNIFYDFNQDRQVTLPKHWEDFDFSSDGERIISKSIGIDPDNRFLVISEPDGGGVRPIQELGLNANKVTVDWSPNNQIVAIAETGRSFGLDTHEVYLIGQNKENFKSMNIEGLNFDPKWSPTGSQLLYSVAGSVNDYKPSLWIVDAAGDNIGRNRKNLNIETWVDKCTFTDSSTLYCGIPDDLERGWGLQPTLADHTPDTIYKIDLNTGARTRIAIPEGSHTIGTIMVSPDERWLYFTEKSTGFLNKIQLKN